MPNRRDSEQGVMHYVGFCRLCGTGPLGLRRCGGCGAIVILCDECDAIWKTADLEGEPYLAEQPTLPCPDCESPLVGGPASWATRDQIDATAWLAEALAQGRLKIESGKPFAADGPGPLDEPLDAGA